MGEILGKLERIITNGSIPRPLLVRWTCFLALHPTCKTGAAPMTSAPPKCPDLQTLRQWHTIVSMILNHHHNHQVFQWRIQFGLDQEGQQFENLKYKVLTDKINDPLKCCNMYYHGRASMRRGYSPYCPPFNQVHWWSLPSIWHALFLTGVDQG